MKKFCFSCLVLIIFLLTSGCNKYDRVDINKFKVNFSIFDVLPKSINIDEVDVEMIETTVINIDRYRSENYYKLLRAYKYIDNLFNVYNQVISDVVKEKNIDLNHTYKYDDYQYTAKEENNLITIEINDFKDNRKINITLDELKNKLYGTHEVNDNIFNFEIIKGSEINIQYDNDIDDSDSYANIVINDDIVKTHIIFNNSDYLYDLVSIASDDFSSVLYNYTSNNIENKYFEVYDKDGYLLYQSISLANNLIIFSGWHMHALTNFNEIEHVNSLNYIIDGEEFNFILTKPNLHLIDIKYLTDNYKIERKPVLLLGRLDFNEDITKIVNVREPFETIYYDVVRKFAKKTFKFYRDINIK